MSCADYVRFVMQFFSIKTQGCTVWPLLLEVQHSLSLLKSWRIQARPRKRLCPNQAPKLNPASCVLSVQVNAKLSLVCVYYLLLVWHVSCFVGCAVTLLIPSSTRKVPHIIHGDDHTHVFWFSSSSVRNVGKR